MSKKHYLEHLVKARKEMSMLQKEAEIQQIPPLSMMLRGILWTINAAIDLVANIEEIEI